MFLDKELPRGTTHNTSSTIVSSGTIKIVQLFENKGDLKIKLCVYVMKKNFEFKVKKSRNDMWFITYIDDNFSWRLRPRKW